MYQFLRKFQPDDALAEAEDLGIVAEDSTFDGERIVSGNSPDASDFVRCNSYTKAGAANQKSAVRLPQSGQISERIIAEGDARLPGMRAEDVV